MTDQLLQGESSRTNTTELQTGHADEQLNLSLYSLQGPYLARGLKAADGSPISAAPAANEIESKERADQGKKPADPFDTAASWLQKHRDDMWLVVSGASYHLNQDVHHNQRNWGLGLEIKLDRDHSVVFGQYRNSIDNESHYGGMTWMPWHLGPVSMGGMFGIIDGYRPLHGKPIPMVMPFASIENKNVGINIMAMPPIGDLSAVVGAQVKFKF